MTAPVTAPLTLRTIRLELARGADFPEGSPNHGYELRAPLAADGHLDAAAFAGVKAKCTARRFWGGLPDQKGHLVRTANHAWAISYAPGPDDDEAIFKLDRHLFKPGEYVTISEPGGGAHTYRVASVA